MAVEPSAHVTDVTSDSAPEDDGRWDLPVVADSAAFRDRRGRVDQEGDHLA